METGKMEWLIESSDVMSIVISLICGCIIGLEREYNNKSAGLRTIILISLGSTIFTIVSKHGVGSDDRIAANIITGIGFIGAGVIFKDRLSVLGLTTAAVIWTTAAIGMAAGIGYYSLALTLTVVTILILSLFTRVENLIARFHNRKLLRITFQDDDIKHLGSIEEIFKGHKLTNRCVSLRKVDNKLQITLEITGNNKRLMALEEAIVQLSYIKDLS